MDVAPTLLGLAGVDEWASHMDGKSIIPLVVDPSDPTVPESVRLHIARHTGGGSSASGSESERAGAAGAVGAVDTVVSGYADNWRKFHFVEYYSLGSITRTGHLVDDPKSNTYRAVRYVGPAAAKAGHGNILYAQFTAVSDWHFQNVSFHEMYDLDVDPYQLNNIYHLASAATLANLTAALDAQYGCSGASCV